MTSSIKHKAVERIWLIPMAEDGGSDYVWCDDPAPGAGMDPADAVEYVRRDAHDARISELEQERDELEAHVERLRERRAETLEQDCHEIIDEWLEAKPQSSLAHRDLLKQAEALESAYEDGDPSTIWSILSVRAQELRQQANELENN